MIQYATKNDLIKIAKCHVAAFPKSISSRLGEKVVASMLQWYLSAPNKFLFYIEENGLCIGYCGGFILDGSDAYGSGSGMTQFGFNEALTGFMKKPWLLLHPEVRSKYKFIFTNILRKIGLKSDSPIVQQGKTQESELLTSGLVVIGVLPNLQQKGIGTQLQQEFERKSRSMGAKKLSLSVRMENSRAIQSYERNGYTISHEEGPSYVMVKLLN